MSQPDRHRNDEFQRMLRNLDAESKNPDERAPVSNEAQPFEPQAYRLQLPSAAPWAIWVLLALNLAIYFVPFLLNPIVTIGGLSFSEYLFAAGNRSNLRIVQFGEYYRFLTAMFLHLDLFHIGFNAYALYALGPDAERIYGTPRFLALYGISGLAGGVASYITSPNPGVGASGAIFGLIGGLAAFYYVSRTLLGEVSRQQLGSLMTIVLINLFIGFSSPNIGNAAHIGGLIGGAIVGWLLAPRFEVDQRLYPPVVVRQNAPLAWAGTFGFLALLIALIAVIQPPIR